MRTGPFLHYIVGNGQIIVGDDVIVDGKCGITFAARFSDRPTLSIGNKTGISHNCGFTVAKRITIGQNCRIASDVWMFDSPGHPADPERRKAGLPPDESDVRPVTVGDNVWIGRHVIIHPGVTVGDDSIIAAGAIVIQDVPAGSIVAGNPARRIGTVKQTPSQPSNFSTASQATNSTVLVQEVSRA